MTRAPIAISCGEPAGVGPEVAAKAWAALKDDMAMFWIGDPRHLPEGTPFETLTDPAQASAICRRALPVLARDFGPALVAGVANPAHAQGVIDAIADGVKLVKSGAARALTTAPIHKQALIDGAGFPHPGHTEFLADLCGVSRVVMMLACDELRVVPATIHIALSEVPRALNPALLTDTILLTHAALRRDFGVAHPRIAVAGLNPHAGEGGKMGDEEIDWIAPTLDALRAEGFDITGPLPADTMFHAQARARYDAAVAMYHDQALIPIKTIDFARGVNITLGLPIVRTSPDHGTAFDIAGKNIADPTSMIEALKMADHMSTPKKGLEHGYRRPASTAPSDR